MAYTDDNTIYLVASGSPDLWVTYKRPGMMSYAKSMEFMSQHKSFNKRLGGGADYETISDFFKDMDASFEHTMSLITAWNIEDAETKEILVTPEVEPNIWQKAKVLYIMDIVQQIKEDPTGSDFLFKNKLMNQGEKDQLVSSQNGSENSMDTVKL